MIQGFQDVILGRINQGNIAGQFITSIPEVSDNIQLLLDDPKLFGLASLFIRAGSHTPYLDPFEQERMTYF